MAAKINTKHLLGLRATYMACLLSMWGSQKYKIAPFPAPCCTYSCEMWELVNMMGQSPPWLGCEYGTADFILCGPDLIKWILKRDWAFPEEEIVVWDGLNPRKFSAAGFEDGGCHVARNSGWPLAESKEMGTLVLQPQGTEFSQQPEWAWKDFFLRAFRKECSLINTLIQSGRLWAEKLVIPCLNIRPTELWGNEQVLF